MEQNKVKIPWAELISSERPKMLRYASYRIGSRDDAEDIVQDVFLRLRTRGKDGGNRELKCPRSYLYRTLMNLCASFLRKSQTFGSCALDEAGNLVAEEPQSFEQDFRRISSLLGKIPEEQAEVIRLRVHSDLSFAEIAESLDVPLPTVKSRFLYGIDKIRKEIKS